MRHSPRKTLIYLGEKDAPTPTRWQTNCFFLGGGCGWVKTIWQGTRNTKNKRSFYPERCPLSKFDAFGHGPVCVHQSYFPFHFSTSREEQHKTFGFKPSQVRVNVLCEVSFVPYWCLYCFVYLAFASGRKRFFEDWGFVHGNRRATELVLRVFLLPMAESHARDELSEGSSERWAGRPEQKYVFCENCWKCSQNMS